MERKHGLSNYNNHGCRCEICRDAKNEYLRAYKKRKKVQGVAFIDERLALTEDQAVKIIILTKYMPYAAVAKRLGMAEETIARISKGLTYVTPKTIEARKQRGAPERLAKWPKDRTVNMSLLSKP